MVDRISRIAEEMRKEISDVVLNDLKDPRLPKLLSIMSVNVTKDLKYAKVYVSVLGNQEEKDNAVLALKSSAGYVRRELGQRMDIRCIPEIQFILDNSIEYGMHISKLINDAVKQDSSKEEN